MAVTAEVPRCRQTGPEGGVRSLSLSLEGEELPQVRPQL